MAQVRPSPSCVVIGARPLRAVGSFSCRTTPEKITSVTWEALLVDWWRERIFTTDEIAGTAGIGTAALRMIVHRHGGDAFSERRGLRRFFSARDVSVLRTARALSPAIPMAEALPIAFAHHRMPPRRGLFIVVADGAVTSMDADGAARAAIECGALVVPVGRFAADVVDACRPLFDAAVAA
ncbi:hypothetical protein [Fulvimarina manganoxydans]|uniref:hypothetical protein n=1 Tax=Fulvimarina manganoxydans TaxID=937218 RepID=UPI00111BEC2C|nr:hypothetical protein [Fulvimarina manganoxydans]